MMWLVLTTLVIVCAAPFIPKVRDFLLAHEIQFKTAQTLVSLLGIISIGIAVASFTQHQKVEKENKAILLQNLDEEIIMNLSVIKTFTDQEESYKTPTDQDVVSPLEFTYPFLSEARSVIKEKETRQLVFHIIGDMDVANGIKRIMISGAPRRFFSSEAEQKSYLKSKIGNVNSVKWINSRVEENLKQLQKFRELKMDAL